MKYPFDISYVKDGDNNYWVAKSKVLNTVIAQGDTAEETLTLFGELEDDWLLAAKKYKFDIPVLEPVSEPLFSGKFMVRISKTVHEKAVETAKEQGISLNQYVNDAIVTANTNADTTKKILHLYLKNSYDDSGTYKGNEKISLKPNNRSLTVNSNTLSTRIAATDNNY